MTRPASSLDEAAGRVRRAFDSAFRRKCAATTIGDLEDELSNLLHHLYRLGELCRIRHAKPPASKLGKAAFGKLLSGSPELRAAHAAMWMRTFDTHELVMVAAPADAYSDQLTAMYGVLVWKPPAPTSDLAGSVLDTMRGAFDALAGLL